MRTTSSRGVRRLALTGGVLALGLSVASPAASWADNANARGNGNGKDAMDVERGAARVWVCHPTGSETNRWVLVEVSERAADAVGGTDSTPVTLDEDLGGMVGATPQAKLTEAQTTAIEVACDAALAGRQPLVPGENPPEGAAPVVLPETGIVPVLPPQAVGGGLQTAPGLNGTTPPETKLGNGAIVEPAVPAVPAVRAEPGGPRTPAQPATPAVPANPGRPTPPAAPGADRVTNDSTPDPMAPVTPIAPAPVVQTPVVTPPVTPVPARPIPAPQPRPVVVISDDAVTRPIPVPSAVPVFTPAATVPADQLNEVLGAVTTRTPSGRAGALDPGARTSVLAATGIDATSTLAALGSALLLGGLALMVTSRLRVRRTS